MLLVLRGVSQNSKWLFIGMCKICWIKNARCISLSYISSNARIMIKNSIALNIWHFILCHLIRYFSHLFSQVPGRHIRALTEIPSISYYKKQNIPLHRDVEYSFMLTTCCLDLSDQKPRNVSLCFFGGLGKEEVKNLIKCQFSPKFTAEHGP